MAPGTSDRAEPLIHVGFVIFEQAFNKRFRIGIGNHHSAMHRFQEPFRDRVIEKAQQAIVVSVDIQDSARLPLQPELTPRENFAELFEGAIPAGQRDERIG